MQVELKKGEEKVDKFLIKLKEYTKSIAKNEGYTDYDVTIKDITTKGGSYLGTLYEVDIKGKIEDSEKETNIFVKNIVESNIPLIYNVSEVYEREYFVYSDLLKEFYKLQEEFDVSVCERYKIAKAFDECNDRTIILENLTAKGFKTLNRMDVISLEYAELAIKDLARLHGLSLAIKVLKPDYYKNKLANLDCVYLFDENWHGFTKNMKKFASSFLEENLRNKIESKLSDIVDKYPDYMRDSSCLRTVCHGDFRPNNIMVREINGKPTEVIVVDYQITYFGNPILDFIYFIFWGTDRAFRKNHLNYLKDLYYQYLQAFLKYFNVCLEDVFPRSEFEKQYREKLDFGLMISVFYLPFLFPLEDDVPDLVDGGETLDKITVKVDEKYRERFREIVSDFIEWGYL